VLIVRAPVQSVRRLVVGYDGTANAERAVDFIASLRTAPGQRVHVVTVVEPVSSPASASLLPSSTRTRIRNQAIALNAERRVKAEKAAALAVRRLQAAGWNAFADARVGEPLVSLLNAAGEHRADVLILGARATRGIERALLGSVANGAVNRARMPVLLAR
jgi:nucleotide-binding universal stress UspA family protein